MQSANDENVDFSELCRICAKKVKNLVSLFHTKRKGKTMAEMLSICLQKSVHQNDGRPTEICLACIPKLLNSFELLITAKSSEHFFQQVILSKICNQKVQPNDQCDESKPIAEIPTVQCVEPLITSEFDEDVKDPLAGGGGEVKTEHIDTSLTTPAARIKTNIQIKPKQHGKMEITNSEEVIQLCSVKRTRFLQCYICKRTPFTLKRLRTHLKKHEDKKPFKCFVCGEVYRLKFDLDHHLCQGDQITCEYCPEVFHTLNGILTHLKMHNADLLVYKCTRCIKEFNLTSLLKYHDAFHDRYQFACKICGKKFATRQTTTNHTRLVHSSERPHLCANCGKGFKDRSTLKKHVIIHSDEKLFACPECPSRFQRKGNLTTHMAVHKTERYVCNICGTISKSILSFRAHRARHRERTKECEICSLKFHTNDQLRTHMRKHTGEKPFHCTYCDVAYSQKNDLVKHLRTHVGENTYMCDNCNKSFRYHAELLKHTCSGQSSEHNDGDIATPTIPVANTSNE